MRTACSSLVALLIAVAVAGCSSADPQPTSTSMKKPGSQTPGGTTRDPNNDVPDPPATQTPAPTAGAEIGSETWKTGKQLAASVTIKAGATVEIEAGAAVTAATGASITVKGTLSVKAGANHAKLSGANWKGIVIAAGGKLEVDGLDIADAEIGLWTQKDNLSATFLNSSITNAATPFSMEAGSKLTVTKSKVVKATGKSSLAGEFVASYMEYDKGANEGLYLNDAAGSMTISDSILKGSGGGDYVVSSAGKLVKIEYTTITGSHCGIHFNAVDKFILDHVSDDQNPYGAMLYGSGAGPHQIIASNVRSTEKNLDMSGVNGALTIDGSYIPGNINNLQPNAKITNAATVAIPNARPR